MLIKPAGSRLSFNQDWLYKTATSRNIDQISILTISYMLEKSFLTKRFKDLGLVYSHYVCIRRATTLYFKFFVFEGQLSDFLRLILRRFIRRRFLKQKSKKAKRAYFFGRLRARKRYVVVRTRKSAEFAEARRNTTLHDIVNVYLFRKRFKKVKSRHELGKIKRYFRLIILKRLKKLLLVYVRDFVNIIHVVIWVF